MRSRFFSKLSFLLATLTPLLAADKAEVVFQRAASALSSQDYVTAERDFRLVLQMEPGNVGALGNLGVVYSRTQRYNDAIEVYKRALKIAPGDPALSLNLGLAYVKQERYGIALPILQKLAGLQAQELVATCLLALGRYPETLNALQPLLSSEPSNPGVLYMQGIALSRLKRTEEAHAAFANMMRASSPAQASFLMGKASYETESFEQAADFFRQALAADPGFDGAHRELGKALVSLRDDEAAEKELRQADPNDPEALYFLGALLSQKRPEEAAVLLKKALERAPDFWGPLYYLGRMDVEAGRINQALPLLQRAAALNPEESAIQYQLGRALQKAGRDSEAKVAFARVKELKDKSLRKEVNVLSPDIRKP